MGLAPETFWALTPFEFHVMAMGYVEREKEKNRTTHNNIISLAWYTEALARTKNLPKLENLLSKKDDDGAVVHKHKEQSDEEMMNVCRMMNAAFGGIEITT